MLGHLILPLHAPLLQSTSLELAENFHELSLAALHVDQGGKNVMRGFLSAKIVRRGRYHAHGHPRKTRTYKRPMGQLLARLDSNHAVNAVV